MGAVRSLCLIFVVLEFINLVVAQPFPAGTVYNGYTTYFPTGGSGSCEYASSDFNQNALEVAALSTSQYDGGVHCGECINITTGNTSIIATIVDSSAGIGANNISLSYYAFSELGGQGYTPIPVSWESVPCPVHGGLIIHTDVGVQDGYYLAFQLVNFRVPVQLMEVKVNGIYKSMTFQTYNEWTLSTGTDLTPPFNIRVTAYTGEQITVTMTQLTAGSDQCINQQFSVANPTTGSTTSDLLVQPYCNDTSDFPVGLTTDGNTPGGSSTNSQSGLGSQGSATGLSASLFSSFLIFVNLF